MTLYEVRIALTTAGGTWLFSHTSPAANPDDAVAMATDWLGGATDNARILSIRRVEVADKEARRE